MFFDGDPWALQNGWRYPAAAISNREAMELREFAAAMRAEAEAEIAARFAWGNNNSFPVGWDERDAKGV